MTITFILIAQCGTGNIYIFWAAAIAESESESESGISLPVVNVCGAGATVR